MFWTLGKFLSLCWTLRQVVIGFFVSASSVTAIGFQAWKTGACMYSEVISINLLPNNWVKLGAIKFAKGSIQCLVNEKIQKGWIICIQNHYEIVLKTKMIVILHAISSPYSRGRLIEGFPTGLFCVCCYCAATDLLPTGTERGRPSLFHTPDLQWIETPLHFLAVICVMHTSFYRRQFEWLTSKTLEPAWANQ